jgi:hypothetical protein
MTTRDTKALHEALARLESWQSSPGATNKSRRFARFPARGEAMLFPGEASSRQALAVDAHIRDISRGGIGLLCDRPGKPGEFWQVRLVTGRVGISTVTAYCRFCRPVIDGMYLVGAEFGIDAAVLLALGISSSDLAKQDEPEQLKTEAREFITPEALLDEEAA